MEHIFLNRLQEVSDEIIALLERNKISGYYYRIVWADILSFGGYSAGNVITDRALILKASRNGCFLHLK